jgi:hypothetical protein
LQVETYCPIEIIGTCIFLLGAIDRYVQTTAMSNNFVVTKRVWLCGVSSTVPSVGIEKTGRSMRDFRFLLPMNADTADIPALAAIGLELSDQ